MGNSIRARDFAADRYLLTEGGSAVETFSGSPGLEQTLRIEENVCISGRGAE